MKIVDIAEFYSETGGGVRTYVNQKLEAGARYGHQIVVIAPGSEDRVETRAGGKIIWVKAPPLPVDPRYYRMFWREAGVHEILDQEAPDVVEGSSPWMGGWIAARWPGSALKAFVFHQDFVAAYAHTYLGRFLGDNRVDRLFGWYWRYLRRLTALYDTTVVSGDWLAARLEGFGLRHPDIVPFGVETERFSPRHHDQNLRRQLLDSCGLNEDAKLLLAVSRFHPEKRLATIINAFAQAAHSQPMGLVIVGDGGGRARVEGMAGRVKNVFLAGAITDRDRLAAYFASADALVHGSAAETYGLVVAEAICSGLPLVVPNRGGASELAAPDFAETYPAGNAEACAVAICRLLARDRNILSQASSEAAAKRIGSTRDHFRALFDFYQERIDERDSLRNA